jgi:hypothetical protein
MERDDAGKVLLGGSYLSAVASLVFLEPLLSGPWAALELGLLALWAATQVACFAVSWKHGLLALPSALFALALPVGFLVAIYLWAVAE